MLPFQGAFVGFHPTQGVALEYIYRAFSRKIP